MPLLKSESGLPGGPLVWKHLVDSENARNVVVAQQGALQTDTTSANKAQVSCAAEIKASMQAASAIAQASRPVVQKAGDPQPLITSDQIKAAIQ